jgi:hypothetical protein
MYHVSELGALRAASKEVADPKPRSHSKGYVRVDLEFDGRPVEMGVHRIVCEAFHGVPLNHRKVLHLDGNMTNNAAFNLRWGPPAGGRKKSEKWNVQSRM